MKRVVSGIALVLCLVASMALCAPPASQPQDTQATARSMAQAMMETSVVETQTVLDRLPAPLPTEVPSSTHTLQPIPEVPDTIEASCVPRNTDRQVGYVKAVINGDTIEVIVEGTSYTIGYIGVNAPNRDMSFYSASRTANVTLVMGETVLLVKDVSEIDGQNRLLRYVFVGQRFVNNEVIANGFGHANTVPPDVACQVQLSSAQQTARTQNAGLWKPTATAVVVLPQQPQVSGNSGAIQGQQPASSGGDCHPSYPTVCIPPAPPDLNCPDIPHKRFQVLPPDPHGFDRDGDGIGCES